MFGISSLFCRSHLLGCLLCEQSLVGDRRTGFCRFWLVIGSFGHSLLLLFCLLVLFGVVLIRALITCTIMILITSSQYIRIEFR